VLQFHDEVTTTMEMAHQWAEAGAHTGDAVVARRQRAGRGQQGRSWSAEVGGLWLSVIGRPDARFGLDPLSLRVGLAVAEALEFEVPGLRGIGLKWPNDLMLRGRKLGGVLSEARWQGGRCLWVVTGIGINLHNPIPRELHDIAITLAEVVDAPLPEALAPAIATAAGRAMHGGPLAPRELEAWRERDVLSGRAITSPARGVAAGITEAGELCVRQESGEVVRCAVGVVALND
jgi:BirA family biotin operon repressor/biotin-[acetyl-CoA-carboxylase] ligase